MKKLKSCVNGCQKPVQEPSKVLCKECLEKLNQKFHGFGEFFENIKKIDDKSSK